MVLVQGLRPRRPLKVRHSGRAPARRHPLNFAFAAMLKAVRVRLRALALVAQAPRVEPANMLSELPAERELVSFEDVRASTTRRTDYGMRNPLHLLEYIPRLVATGDSVGRPFGFKLNFGKGKKETLLSLRGKHFKAVKRQVFL